MMVLSHTQVANYLHCPRHYQFRYIEGWREKDDRSSVVFGRSFELALGALYLGRDAEQVLFDEWSRWRSAGLQYAQRDSWDKMLHQGIALLQLFAQQSRLQLGSPPELQVQIQKQLDSDLDFLGYIDAIGVLDGTPCLVDWKTTSVAYADDRELLALDPQLVCYAWLTGIKEIALIVFVRGRLPRIQYLPVRISNEQTRAYEALVLTTAEQIRKKSFHPHPGVRFPHNQCVSCPHLGLCINREQLVKSRLVRRTGADFDWLDQITF
jgi:hypothetical protein